jgi:hypothetical protein
MVLWLAISGLRLTTSHIGAGQAGNGIGSSGWILGHADAGCIALVDIVDEQRREQGMTLGYGSKDGRETSNKRKGAHVRKLG